MEEKNFLKKPRNHNTEPQNQLKFCGRLMFREMSAL